MAENQWPLDMSHMRFKKIGIDIPDGSDDKIRTTCPQCSHMRKPEHQAEKCLQVWVRDGNAYCHNCHWAPTIKGTHSNAVIAVERDSYVYAPLPSDMQDWFAGRGISPENLERNGVTWNIQFFPQLKAKSRCIQFPYKMNGHSVFSKFRTESHDGRKCFVSSPNSRHQPPYGYDDIKGKGFEKIIIVEGEIDKLSWNEIGVNFCVSLPNGGIQPNANGKPPASDNKKLDCLAYIMDEINAAKWIVLAMDDDDVGKITREELERRIGKEKCMRVRYPAECNDSNDVLRKRGSDALQKVLDDAEEIPIAGLITIDDPDARDQYWRYYDEGYDPTISTGLKSLDWYFMLRAKEFTVVTGTPSAGKSVLIDNIAVSTARDFGWHWCVFSPESDPPARYMKHLAWIYIGKPFDKQYEIRMTRDEAEMARRFIRKHFTVISREDHKADVGKILELGRMSVCRYGSQGMIIDPWNRFEHLVYQQGFHNETSYIAAMLDEMMTFNTRNSLHTFLVAHPTKFEGQNAKRYNVGENGSLDEKPVGLYGISGGANFYNMTYNGLVVHRNLNAPQSNKTKVIIEKIKFVGETGRMGEVELRFDRFSRRFHDLESELKTVARLRQVEMEMMRRASLEQKPMPAAKSAMDDYIHGDMF